MMASSSPTLVNIGTHSLALYTHGPESTRAADPVVLFVQGVGCSSLGWAAVVRQLSLSLRSYTYDRSGFTKSEESPLSPTAENVALELSLLIKKAPISNPLILVGHSWAGVLISEFLAMEGNVQHVAGVVLVDANHETAPLVLDVNDPILLDVFEGVDAYSAKGLNEEHKMTKVDWDAFRADESTDKWNAIAAKEDAEYAPSFPTLRKKDLSRRQPLLGNRPVYVIGGMRSRDWKGMYKAAVAKGNGTAEQRRHVEEMILTADEKSEGLMNEHLKLSTKGKVVFAFASGHFVQLTQPEIVVHGVKWILDSIKDTR